MVAQSLRETGDNGALSLGCVTGTNRTVSRGLGGAASWAIVWRRKLLRLARPQGQRQILIHQPYFRGVSFNVSIYLLSLSITCSGDIQI